MGIVYRRGGNELLKAYADADWAGNRDDRRSTTGYVIYLADGPISYNSVSQKSVALSSYESETMSGSTCASEVIYANRLRLEMEANKPFQPPNIEMDNQSTLEASQNTTSHGKAKHIDIREHFLREKVEQGLVTTSKIAGEENPADLFTKALARDRHRKLCAKGILSSGEKNEGKTGGEILCFTCEPTVGHRTQYLNLQFNGTELPFHVDSACYPNSMIPERFLRHVIYEEADRFKIEIPYQCTTFSGERVWINEHIHIVVTTCINKSEDQWPKVFKEIEFGIVYGATFNFVLLNEE